MAKITDSVYVTLTSPASNDIVPIVDVSDTTMSPAGTTKQTTVADLTAGVTLPLSALGDTLYENATPAPAKLAGNTSATKKFLTQTGTGSVSAAPGWNTIGAGDLPTGAASLLGVFGSGTDGSLNFDGTSTVLGLIPSAGVYTLNRDIQATSIQVGGSSTATTIKTANYRIFCAGTVTIASNGTVSNAGNPASGATPGAVVGAASFVGGTAGGAGGTGASGAGAASSPSRAWGASGGSGGAGVSGTAGAGGTATISVVNATANSWITPLPAICGLVVVNGTTQQLTGACGGGGGGSDSASNAGGGGGAGGGIVAILAWAIANAGTITVAGGNGGNGVAGNAGGGGGGSGGFILAYTLSSMTGSGTTTTTGGNGGAHGGSGGTAGSNGGTGTALNVVLI